MANKNLYDNISFFQLLIDGNVYQIDEPINWDKITLELPRDKESFAFNFEFVDDSVQLAFANDTSPNELIENAYDLVKGIYDLVGSDGVIVLQYGYFLPHTSIQKVQFTGNVNLNTYVDEKGQITCSVEKTSFENLARSRFETPISLNAVTTLDGKTISQAQSYTIRLHSKKINKQFKSEITNGISAEISDISRFVSVQIDSSNPVTSEIEENQGLPLAISGVDPRDEDRYFFRIVEAGDYTLKVRFSFDFTVVRGGIGPVGNWNFVPRLMVQRSGATIDYTTFEDFRQSGTEGSRLLVRQVNCNFELSKTWNVDDRLYLDVTGQMQYAGASYSYRVDNYTGSIQLLGQTTALSTTSRSYRLFDAITKMVEISTGQIDSVISSILGPGGAMYKTFISNGYAIRNFTSSDKPVITNIKDFIDSVAAIGGLGYGYTKRDGKDYFIIEPIEYFYRNMEITRIDDLYDYREEQAKEQVFNEIEVGYEKFAEEELNTLDEFNTYQTNLMPIKTYKAKFPKKSKYIASGYSIESQRREQFKDNPSESLSTDDEIFIISCNEGILSTFAYYVVISSTVLSFDRPMNFTPGTSFTIKGGNLNANDGKTVTVSSKVPGELERYNVTGPALLNDNGNILVQQTLSQIQAEKNELFEVVTGLFSPETSYNLRFSPKRMLFNWAQFLNIMVYKKPGSDVIKSTFVKNNDKMVSFLSTLDVNRRNEPDFAFGEAGETTLTVYRGGNKAALHQPIMCYFKSPINYDDFNYIKERLTGEAEDINDYGWIYFLNDKDEYVKGFIYSLKYQPAKEIAEFQVAKIANY